MVKNTELDEKKVSSKKNSKKTNNAPVNVKENINKKTVSTKKINNTTKKQDKQETTTTAITNPMAEVMLIKAKNEEKELAKASKKLERAEAKTKAKEVAQKVKSVYDKGHKKGISSSKEVFKDSVSKAEAKKFIEKKEEICSSENCKTCFIKAWLDGFIKVFDYKSRTTRYEFWAFNLTNLLISIFISVIFTTIYGENVLYMEWIKYVFNSFYIIQMIALLSMSVRRLHDIGDAGWKGYFQPITYSALGLLVSVYSMRYITPDTSLYTSVDFISLLFFAINLYYLLKLSVAISIIESERVANAYGDTSYADRKYTLKTIRYISWYLLILLTFAIFITVRFFMVISSVFNLYQ